MKTLEGNNFNKSEVVLSIEYWKKIFFYTFPPSIWWARKTRNNYFLLHNSFQVKHFGKKFQPILANKVW